MVSQMVDALDYIALFDRLGFDPDGLTTPDALVEVLVALDMLDDLATRHVPGIDLMRVWRDSMFTLLRLKAGAELTETMLYESGQWCDAQIARRTEVSHA
jgi:hypothetical protein